MSSQRKRKRSEKQDNTGRHQLYDWTKQTRKFSLKWKDDFPRDSLEENNRICWRSWQWQHVIWDVSATLFPEFAAVCDMLAKFSTLYALEILNVMCDYNEIYLSIFSVFHEIMLRAKWTSRNDDRISTFRGSLQGGPYCRFYLLCSVFIVASPLFGCLLIPFTTCPLVIIHFTFSPIYVSLGS